MGLEFIGENGTQLNGFLSNGFKSNGFKSNGFKSNGFKSNGIFVNGNLEAQSDDGIVHFSSTDLVNSEIDALLEDSSTSSMLITGVSWAPEIQGYLYEVKTWNGSTWTPACGTDTSGNPVKAVAMANRWDLVNGSFIFDSNLFTFACVNAALGKCAMWGYWRWSAKQECKGGSCKNQDLAYWHEACQHMVRADYCGNGVPHTRNGTTIDVYDGIGVQSRAYAAGFSMEAEWRHDGAHCIQHTRWTKAMDSHPYNTDLAHIQAVCPERLAANNPGECANESSSNYYTVNGFNTSLTVRKTLRNDSIPQ
ncbi:MAG: ADYC domain-containing protein [Polyangia bacterium]